MDAGTGHVFVPRGSHILVLDKELNGVADIPGVDGAHAIAIAPELKKHPVRQVLQPRLHVQWSGTQGVSVIYTAPGKGGGTVPPGGKPEFAQTDLTGHIFINPEDKGQIVDFDAEMLCILHTWPPRGSAWSPRRRSILPTNASLQAAATS